MDKVEEESRKLRKIGLELVRRVEGTRRIGNEERRKRSEW